MDLFLFACFILFNLARASEHITGGTAVSIEQYPFAVALLEDGSFFCGGVILDKISILTAAHCAYQIPAQGITVRVGSTRHDSGGEVLSVANTYIHPLYRPETTDYDVAILKLSSPIDFSVTSASSIKFDLLRLLRPNAGTRVTAVGWGLTSKNGGDSIFLQAVENVILNQQSCRYKLDGADREITARMICAESTPAGRGVCPGDSGGE